MCECAVKELQFIITEATGYCKSLGKETLLQHWSQSNKESRKLLSFESVTCTVSCLCSKYCLLNNKISEMLSFLFCFSVPHTVLLSFYAFRMWHLSITVSIKLARVRPYFSQFMFANFPFINQACFVLSKMGRSYIRSEKCNSPTRTATSNSLNKQTLYRDFHWWILVLDLKILLCSIVPVLSECLYFNF